jgi:glutamine synthetase
MDDFVTRHDLWSDEQHAAAAEATRAIGSLSVVRLAFADAHGVLRGKTLVAAEAARALRAGCTATSTMLLKDLSGRTAFAVFTPDGGAWGGSGAGDMMMVPDPTTFRVLPWSPHSGWVLCDLTTMDGTPHPFSTRHLMKRVLARAADRGFAFCAGLEVEFHLFRLAGAQPQPDEAGPPGPPPAVELLNNGYQYLTELRYDEMDPILDHLRADLQALGLPLRSLEIEFGPSQIEVTFAPTTGLVPADLMTLFRSATKQICRRRGYHATFMCRPQLPAIMSSGWHLHQSLRSLASGRNAFMADAAAADGAMISPVARAYLGGLLAHAQAATAFSTPTINGYKRYRPNSMAPSRACWARDNRGVMVRVLGGTNDPGTRLENRIGEPAANPYLYMASQITAGLDGLARATDPGPPAEAAYDGPAPALPRSLMDALVALRDSEVFRDGFGDRFVEYFIRLKEAEIGRFLSEVTDWEHREYFGLL